MVENGLKPVYVFDGKPPKMKSHELEKRKEHREKAQVDLEEAKEVGTTAEVKILVKSQIEYFLTFFKFFKFFFSNLNFFRI